MWEMGIGRVGESNEGEMGTTVIENQYIKKFEKTIKWLNILCIIKGTKTCMF